MINQNPRPFYVLIVAGGSGARFGGDIPKQFLKVHGKSVLRHSIDKFLSLPGFQGMKVVMNPAFEAPESIPTINAGKDRKQSVYNGLKIFSNLNSEDIILIHDAARPCVSPDDILKLLDAMDDFEAATLCASVPDTLRRSNQDTVSRDDLYAIQTPQAFRYGTILKAHETALPDKEYTDDTALVIEAGIPVKLVTGSRANIKLTTTEDLPMIEALLHKPGRTTIGTGFDVHVLEENPDRPLMLCGVKIPSSLALTGHSDADVGLHALTDALLGAIGMGDIGDHFPPSNPAFKDMDSALFLQKAADMMCDKGGHIVNADITLICEEPKIGPHKDAMRARIADILGVANSLINIKATTTEKLGFTGRGEGIAAQAVVSVVLP